MTNNEVVAILSYADTEKKISILDECIDNSKSKGFKIMINSEFTGITNELDISTITFAQNSIIITKRTNKEKEYFKRGYRFQGCVDNICHFG
jgi:hypothetical protein